MAVVQKVTFIFDGRLCGWTESHWFNSPDGVHLETAKKARDLALARAMLLGVECSIKAIRVSTEGVGPDAHLTYVNYRPTFEVASNGALLGEKAAQKDVALQVRMEDGTHSKHKLIFLRGIWDSVENDMGVYTPSKAWQDLFAKFATQLVRREWGWFGSAGKTKVRLISAVMNETDTTTFTFAENLFPADKIGKRVRVRISGVNEGRSVANGVHVVKVTSQTACVTEFRLAVGNQSVGGFGAFNTYEFISYQTYDDQKIVTRETGAPLLESPGRRSRRARA